ncbi:MAG: type II toxin-antitoxin system VapC family toxin [Acidimicrobiales bacterium]
MTLLYADTSALVRAYFSDEPDHGPLRAMLREGTDPVVTSDLARLELTSATYAAARAGRLRRPQNVVARFDADCRPEGPIALIELEGRRVFPESQRVLAVHPLRSLDAIHLAVALVRRPGAGRWDRAGLCQPRDEAQCAAAQAEGLRLR